MNDKSTKIIVFLSGKGGSGKTTVAISFAKLLSDIGKQTVLIDFDLSTNGASYFFKSSFNRSQRGIWECLESQTNSEAQPWRLPNSIEISDSFQFVPSRVSLGQKGPSYDSVSYEKDLLKKEILQPIVQAAVSGGADYVLIDCQAGFAVTSTAASEISDMAIIVTEADSISSDAADNLLIQLGTSLPSEKKYLVNKIDVRDADTYRQMRNVFQTLNRLPPLPFDFEVRNAFGARQIPIDVNKPSALLFALLETISSALPEIQNDVQTYRRTHIDQLFERYDEQLQKLLLEKKYLEEKLSDVRSMELDYRRRILNLTTMGFGLMSVFLGGYFFLRDAVNVEFQKLIIGAAGALIAIVGVFSSLIFKKRTESRLIAEKQRERIQSQLSVLSQDVDRYRSLLLVKSRDFLVDVEIAKRTKIDLEGNL